MYELYNIIIYIHLLFHNIENIIIVISTIYTQIEPQSFIYYLPIQVSSSSSSSSNNNNNKYV